MMENPSGERSESASHGLGKGVGDNGGMTLNDPSKQLLDLRDNIATDEATGEKLMKIFGNHLVVGRIMSYLDHTSIKFLSQTCQTLLGIVRGNRDFLDRTKINISGLVKVYPLTSFQQAKFPWKNVTVQLHVGSDENHLAILPLLAQMESLEIYSEIFPLAYSVSVKVQVSRLMDFLSVPDGIKELTIGVEIFTTSEAIILPDLIRNSEKAKSNLEKLKSLCITQLPRGYVTGPNFAPSIIAIGAEFTTCLTSFILRSRHGHVVTPVVVILQKHKTTLKSISWDSYEQLADHDTSNDGIYGIVFPALKELHFQADGSELEKVSLWLAKQPPLVSLSLKFAGSPVGASRPLLTPLLIHGPTLHKFSLVWKLDVVPPLQMVVVVRPNYVDDDDNSDDEEVPNPWQAPAPIAPPPPPWDFSFLRNFGSLCELKIHHLSVPNFEVDPVNAQNRGALSSPGSILAAIPDGIRTINLSGTASGTWNNDDPQTTIESLGRFRNLTVLNLVRCAGVVDDETLGFIFTNLSQLLEFGFSHCEGVTDSGLTGKYNGESNVAGIQALTGLVKLWIMCCPHLTPEGFLNAIVFPDLKFLSLIMKTVVEQSFYEKIAAQNKSLEVFEISSNCREQIDSEEEGNVGLRGGLEDALKRQSPRFRTLAFRNPPHPNLKNESSDEGDEFSEAEDSSVSGGGRDFGRHRFDHDVGFDSDDLDYEGDDFGTDGSSD